MNTSPYFTSRARAAFSLIESLVAVAALSSFTAIAIFAVNNVTGNSGEQKLKADVAAINTAIRVYKANGGKIVGSWKEDKILAELKTIATAESGEKLAGLRSAMLDARVDFVMETFTEAAQGNAKALWDATNQRFYVAHTNQRGIRKFVMNDELGEAAQEERNRESNLELAVVDDWIWDYEDRDLPPVSAPQTPVTPGSGPSGGITGGGDPFALDPPEFSIPGGTYPLSSFGMEVYLTNPNPSTISEIQYSVTPGIWVAYGGEAIPVTPETSIEAYAASTEPENWNDSAHVLEAYATVPLPLIAGLEFSKPAYTYAEVGGAMIPGIYSPELAGPGVASILNAPDIPSQYVQSPDLAMSQILPDNSELEIILDSGLDGPVPITLADFGTESEVTYRVVARHSADEILDSEIVSRTLEADPALLRPAPIREIPPPSGPAVPGEHWVQIDLETEMGDMPVGARIFYTTDGSDPGDNAGNPSSPTATLYSNPFLFTGVGNEAIKARVYGPATHAHWFIPSTTTSLSFQGAPSSGSDLWAIQRQPLPLLIKFVDYDQPSVSMVNYGQLHYQDGANVTPISSQATIPALTITDDGIAYFVGPPNLTIDGTTYGAPLMQIDLSSVTENGTPVATLAGDMSEAIISVGAAQGAFDISGLAVAPSGAVYAIFWDEDNTEGVDRLLRFNSLSTDSNQIFEDFTALGAITGAGETSTDAHGIDFAADGTLYLADNATDKIYTVDSETAAITGVFSTQGGSNYLGMAISPSDGNCVAASAGGTTGKTIVRLDAGTDTDTAYFDYQAKFSLGTLDAVSFMEGTLGSPPDPPSGDSLWAIENDANAHLLEFRNYNTPLVECVNWGPVHYSDGGVIRQFGTDSGIESLAITAGGEAYFVRNNTTGINGGSYLRPLFRIDIAGLQSGDTVIATFVGDLEDFIESEIDYIDPASSQDIVTGLGISADGFLHGVYALDSNNSADFLFRIDTFTINDDNSLIDVALVGQLAGAGEIANRVGGMAFAPGGTLYVTDTVTDELYVVDPATAAIQGVHASNAGQALEDIAINPNDDDFVASDVSGANADTILSVGSGNGNYDAYFGYGSMFGFSDIRAISFFTRPLSPTSTAKSESLWALAEDGNGKLKEFKNYQTADVSAYDWGSIKYESNGSLELFSSPSELESLTITDAGIAYFARNSSTTIDGVTYSRPLFSLDILALNPGDTPIATFVGDLDAGLEAGIGESGDVVTGIAIDPATRMFYFCYDGDSDNYLFTIDSLNIDANGNLTDVTLVGDINSASENSSSIEDISFAPDGTLYATDAGTEEIYIVDPATAEILSVYSYDTFSSKIEAIAIYPGDGDIVISDTVDDSGEYPDTMWSVRTGADNNVMYFDYATEFGLTDIEGIAFFTYDANLSSGPQTIILDADFDTSIAANVPNWSGDGVQLYCTHDNPTPSQTLVHFDITDNIPSSAIIESAVLYLTSTDPHGSDEPFALHSVFPGVEWIDGGFTWNEAGNGLQTDNTELSSAAIAQSAMTNVIPGIPGSADRKKWDITALVQGWVDTPPSNNGLAVLATSPFREIFCSKEHAGENVRPKLVITYR